MTTEPSLTTNANSSKPPLSGPAAAPVWVGLALVFAAAALWSLNGALIKLTDREGVHAVTIAFYRSLFAGLFLLPLARGKLHTLRRRDPDAPGTNPSASTGPDSSVGGFQPVGSDVQAVAPKAVTEFSQTPPTIRRPLHGSRWIALRPAAIWCVVFFTLMTACFVMANTMTKAANAIILQYTSTFWIFGLSPWLLGERPRLSDLKILAVAMTGIAVIFAGNAGTDLLGLLIALGAGLFYALLTLMIRLMRDSDSAAVTVVNNLGSALLLFPFALLFGGLMVSRTAWVLLLIMGVIQFGLPYYLYTLGLARIPAYRAALVTLTEPVLVPMWTYLAVKEAVPLTTAIGGGIILAALILFIRAARIHARRVAAHSATEE